MLTALQVSSHFIKKGVSPLKLQKLLFYAQVWYYVKNDCKLFSDDIQAWVLGPVVEHIWQSFKHFRRGDVINVRNADDSAILNDYVTDHLNEVWNVYGKYTGVQLVDITHEENLWLSARQGVANYKSSKNIITIDKYIHEDFRLDKLGNIPKAFKNSPGYGQIYGTIGEELF